MAYAMVLEIRSGFPSSPPTPTRSQPATTPDRWGWGAPSWEKAATYVVMALVLIFCGGGLFSLDNLLIEDLLNLALA